MLIFDGEMSLEISPWLEFEPPDYFILKPLIILGLETLDLLTLDPFLFLDFFTLDNSPFIFRDLPSSYSC